MNLNQFALAFYILFWVVRIRGCVRRWQQPLLRGREWFFNVQVQPGFYAGAGRRILHRYWMRMFIPFAIDIPAAVAILISGHLALLNLLVLVLAAAIHINHMYSVDLAERQARAFAAPETEQPVTSVALSLTPRRLRDYMNRKVEWALAACSIVALAWLTSDYFAAPEHHNLRLVFWLPLYCLYVQVGILFVKQIVVTWRTSVPQAQAAEYIEAREETRKFYLRQCDWARAIFVGQMLLWPIAVGASPTGFKRLMMVWMVTVMAACVVLTVWIEIRRKQLVKLALRTRPMKLPDFLNERGTARWPVCYQPSAPMLMLRGSRGYSLNLANALTYFGAVYLMGWTALFALLPKGH